ncbi:class I fructose-bisphosphate aldolase [Devosia nitrariae]|uniref:fructose-bisphosphate aldolase n=1 Tax=Devosia nitrariae TaxID=2071872 RepID=A0ABQ5W926_9HYPH|nr:class I fructose-bisphosphate aldolase [Devosia nitrariae]GLQ56597.1 fructose-bisphosphate aldolase [Devosia nitrariae]
MRISEAVQRVLNNYGGERPGVKANLARLLMHGRTGGSGKLVILPVDQGFEHGPGRSFSVNPAAYDPHYHFELAIEAGLSALAAPLGLLTAGADRFAGALPLILKANNADNLSDDRDQAVTAGVRDALQLGCSAIGYTIYPGCDRQYEMFEEVREGIAEARDHGLAVVVWAYPRGRHLGKDDETALDVVAYGAQIAAQLGAHIIKVKPPSAVIAQAEARPAYEGMDLSGLATRVRHVMQAAFAGRRIVVFSGGPAKDVTALYDEIAAIRDGGGHGSIVGRNSFQRPFGEARDMLGRIIDIHLSQAGGQGP